MIMAKIIVFQESSIWAVRTGCKVSVLWQKTEAKQEPHITSFKHLENKSNCSIREFSCKFFTWLCLRYCNRFQQTYSNLSGILCKLWQKQFNIQPITVSKKIETHLSLLTTKATDPQAIYLYLKYFQGLAKEMNMSYVNVTLDVVASINAYELLSKNSQQFSNVIINLGNFHMIKENF